jgi:hypothetical protein
VSDELDKFVGRLAVLEDIDKERQYQEIKWGVEFDNKNTANDWSAYISRYNGNASFAVSPTEWRKQMIKVAALAVAAVEAYDRNGSLPDRHYDKV